MSALWNSQNRNVRIAAIAVGVGILLGMSKALLSLPEWLNDAVFPLFLFCWLVVAVAWFANIAEHREPQDGHSQEKKLR